MTNRIADLRTTIETPEQARTAFQKYVLLEKTLAAADAKLEKKIAVTKALHADANMLERAQADELKTQLAAFVSANRGLFEKPRTWKMDMGELGLRTATELVISDEEALFDGLLERGYDDCYTTVRSPVKPAIRGRLEKGESLPGCQIKTGDTVVCKPAKALLDQAREEAVA